MAMQNDPWFAYIKSRPAAKIRLFCFPFAGGGAGIYRTWSDALPTEIEVIPVQLPGRERRMAEKPFTAMPSLVDVLLGVLEPHLRERPFAFFGHSMGATIAFELSHRLRETQGPMPLALLASARMAPHRTVERDPFYHLPMPEFKARLAELDGTPEAVLQNEELMDLMAPLLRADFELIDTYPETRHPRFEFPVFAYGGLGDHEVSEEDVRAWDEVTDGPCTVRMLQGGHFFINEDSGRRTLLQAVATDLLSLA